MNLITKAFMSILKMPILNPLIQKTLKHLANVSLHDFKGIETLEPSTKEKCIKLITRMEQLGKPVYMFEGLRTAKRQSELYKQGRLTGGRIVTNAKALQSAHQYGLAFDLIFEKYKWNPPNHDWWVVLGEEGKKLGLKWGGSFGDYPHFESEEFDYKTLEEFYGNKPNN